MNLPQFRTTIFPNSVTRSSQSLLPVTCYFRRQTFSKQPITHRTIPARDRAIDFGKYKGKMLGTLPSTYLKWVSKNLRARDLEEWAKLADQVLQDPVYQDRMEWEFAENVLNGNRSKAVSSSSSGDDKFSAVAELMEISERFGWDNDDKAGWAKVKFELLGTSKGGRIPRLEKGEEGDAETVRQKKESGLGVASEGGESDRRRERRERQKKKTGGETQARRMWSGLKEKNRGSFVTGDDVDSDAVLSEVKKVMGHSGWVNPFPGREALLRKVASRRRFGP